MSIPNDYTVQAIESSQTYEWFLYKHYAKRIPNISYSFGLYDRNKFLKGVCSFAKPMSHTLVQGALGGKFTDTFLELNRLVVNDNLKKNTLSFFVSQSLMLLPKPQVVVSYADSSQHHHGYIYQATNWIYTGLSSKFTDYAVKGLEHMHHSSIEDSVGRYDKDKGINKHQLLKKKYGDLLYKKERPRKHRYFYVLGNKKQRKEMIRNLAYKVKPYPKGDNKKYDASYKPSTQGVLF
tara:strand:+ start:27 stop:734 length:708 start_codon:yes stop_codon:yes gene_type:complete